MPPNEDIVFITDANTTPLLSQSNSSANLAQTTLPPQNPVSVRRIHFCPEFLRAMESVRYIADCTRRTEEENEVILKIIDCFEPQMASLVNVT